MMLGLVPGAPRLSGSRAGLGSSRVSRCSRTICAPAAKIEFVSPNGDIFTEQDIMTECLLLPHESYEGVPPADLVGEVMLQELEDREETNTQLFFNSDGTIMHGATDGPPPAGFCGLWQCGDGQFQMTLSRAFSTPSAVIDPSQQGRMKDAISYTVVRVYEGVVDNVANVGTISGRIDLVKEEEAATWAGSNATSIDALDPFSSIKVPPIGYFVLDINTNQELSD
eukprot:CAMPEP_0119311152 /NCGR_PEP_ID=MMETSP1333-20130426/21932_1 /TAXON_ID=418940 /ORGANISM="Scyphosphaera apsteinii, Strain RCC1455" /LENGTH=224 /DNA_ID=CAMNT_0007315473 /DNA_START=32 /DNA_END=706 /DNA_ORIENTATION=+